MDDAEAHRRRADFVTAQVAKGRTAEQVEAFMDLVASGFRRRGWAAGEPLTEGEREERTKTFLGVEDA